MNIKNILFCLFILLAQLNSIAQQNSIIYELRFGRNKYELSIKNKEDISLIFDSLKNKKNYKVYINGHSDSDADSSYNQKLSLKRSISVKDFLLGKGIDETLVIVQASGEEQPIVTNTTAIEKAKNRRVELYILFEQKPAEKIIEPNNILKKSDCDGDTTVTLEGDYVVTLSKCDWEKNSECLIIKKHLTYKFKTKENWLKKHIGFKNYKKTISYEPHYEFNVYSCLLGCFKKPLKLYIPQYQAPTLKTGVSFSQKRNDKNNITSLTFKKAKLGEKAYYVANIYCTGLLNCCTEESCIHPVKWIAKNNISILSYSYYQKRDGKLLDTLIEIIPPSSKEITDIYPHSFLNTLEILYKGDTVTLINIPLEVFAHGLSKIKNKKMILDKLYFLFIPYRKKYKCGHFKKYKIRAKDLKNLKRFNMSDLQMESFED